MAKLNLPKKVAPVYTASGARAARINPEQQLRRLTATTLLWEDGFYVSGKTVAETIADLVPKCRPEFVAACAYEARTVMKLRHLPLLVVREMARHTAHKALVSKLLPDVIDRADELSEFLAIYWKDGRQPLSAQVKKGLAAAFAKFNEYELAKYNRDGDVKLRDVAFLAHAKPWDGLEGKKTKVERKYKKDHAIIGAKMLTRHTDSVLSKLVEGRLKTPETWETQLSAGADKAGTFTQLMEQKKLGGLAYLRNLRGMLEAGTDRKAVRDYAAVANFSKVLPFRFIAAARAYPGMEDVLEPQMLKVCENMPKLKGRTLIVLDVSGSMDEKLSAKSDLTRLDAACGLAMILREICEDVQVLTFSQGICLIPPRRGFALAEAITKSQPHGGTALFRTMEFVNNPPTHQEQLAHDRIIVLTDEQDTSHGGYTLGAAHIRTMPDPKAGLAYLINVASNKNGVGYGKWTHIDGWSEGIVSYLQAHEEILLEEQEKPEATPMAA